MKTLNFPTSACRYCRHYCVEGRRGGMCQQLGGPVRGSWKACSLALPQFASSWESIEQILQEEKLILKEAICGNGSLNNSNPDLAQAQTSTPTKMLVLEAALV
ncbi:MAG TPA: hypothetical protein V6D14_17805 [Coleofasciculaceae cyanobacterium]